MAITGERLRELMAQALGFYFSGTNTGTSSSAVTDANIARYDTGSLTNKWVLITSGNRDTQSRRIASTASTTSTLVTALSGALANGDTFLILPYDPDVMDYNIEQACRNLWPEPTTRGIRGLYRDDTQYAVVDNLLDNFSFESSESTGAITVFADYDATVEGTTLVTSATHGLTTGDTITISGTTNYNGTFEVVVVSASTFWIRTAFIADDATGTWREGVSSQAGTASGWTATAGTWTFPRTLRAMLGTHAAYSASSGAQLTQNIFTKVNLKEVAGKTLRLRGWAFTTATSTARLRASFDGGATFTNGTYHTGSDQWEYLELDAAVPVNATSITIYLEVGTATATYWDSAVAYIDPIAEYPLTVYHGPYEVWQQVDEHEPRGTYRPLDGYATSGRVLRIKGIAPLTVPTTDTMATEADDNEAQLIIAEAAWRMFRVLKNTNVELQAEYGTQEQAWHDEALRLRAHSKFFPSAHSSQWWRVRNDTTPRTLVLPR